MGHQHSHIHHNTFSKGIQWAFFLNLSFTIIEIGGGFYTNSMAILSDALHDLGDTLAIGLAWYFEKFSKKKRDGHFTYGYKRFSLAAAIINSIILLIGSLFIIYETIPRLLHPEKVLPEGMLLLALLGIAANGAAVLVLKSGHSANEKTVRLHLMEDVLGWIAVLLGSIIMIVWEVPVIDPILSLLIALYILINAYKNLKEFLSVILQGIPNHIDIHQLEEELKRIHQVCTVHDIHLWSLDGNYHIMSLHLVVKDHTASQQIITIKEEAKKIILSYQIQHPTIEIEFESEECRHED